MVKDARPVELRGHTYTLEFQNPLFVDKMERNEKGRKTLEDIINRTLDAEPGTYKVKAVLRGAALPAKVAQSRAPRVREAVPAPEAPSPFVEEVIRVFGGRILDDTDSST